MGQMAARLFAEQGYSVAALDVNEKGLLETAENHQNIRTFNTDVTNYDAVASVVDETEAKLGPIKRVYNAAAIMPLGKVVDQDVEIFHRVMDINYKGVVNVSKAVMPRLLERNEGELINFASLAGWMPILYMAAYNASKFAVVAFTEVLAHEHTDSNVKVLCVCPPPVKTPLLNQARDTVWPKVFDQTDAIEPEDVLAAIEKALARDELFVFPGKKTRMAQRMRRWFPNLIWKNVHQTEGI
jgi:short-subunit dehydrogenase